MSTVYVVVGDIGSAKEIVPAALELAKRGHTVHWFADPKGKAGSNVLAKSGIYFETRGPVVGDRPDALVVGTSATAVDAQISWTRFGRERGIPVIWLEDLWGTGERSSTREVDPDAMLVNDEAAALIAKTARPSLKTIVVGRPTFVELNNLLSRVGEIRTRIRNQLDIREEEFFISYYSGGESVDRARTHLSALASLLEELSYVGAVLAPRLHPKLPDEFKKEMKTHFIDESAYVIDANEVALEELMIASDLVVAEWTVAEGYKAVLLGASTIITLFPDDNKRLEECGCIEGWPPLVRAQAAFGARNEDELVKISQEIVCSRKALKHETGKRRLPFAHLLEPGAVSRIADAVEHTIKSSSV